MLIPAKMQELAGENGNITYRFCLGNVQNLRSMQN